METTFRLITWEVDPVEGFQSIADIVEVTIRDAFRRDGKMRAATIKKLAAWGNRPGLGLDYLTDLGVSVFQQLVVR